jgi:2-(1,2-epoxy-1,2-dihydrophenyl)acetyl-CoA isomerase
MYKAIVWEVREHTGILTLNRPDRLNALDIGMRSEIADVVRKAEHDPEVWTIILTGTGRGFCSGADLKARAESEGASGGANASSITVQPMFDVQYFYPIAFGELSKPVIAAINGVTRGAGNNMAFAADFRIASERANFGCNFVERGLMAEASAYYLPRLVGRAIATEICMLGEPFDAAQAKAWGLVNKVVPHESLMDEAMALARKLNSKAPIAVRMTKQALHRAHDLSAEQFVDMQNTMNSKLRATADAKEALAAFIEKRPAKFKGA